MYRGSYNNHQGHYQQGNTNNPPPPHQPQQTDGYGHQPPPPQQSYYQQQQQHPGHYGSQPTGAASSHVVYSHHHNSSNLQQQQVGYPSQPHLPPAAAIGGGGGGGGGGNYSSAATAAGAVPGPPNTNNYASYGTAQQQQQQQPYSASYPGTAATFQQQQHQLARPPPYYNHPPTAPPATAVGGPSLPQHHHHGHHHQHQQQQQHQNAYAVAAPAATAVPPAPAPMQRAAEYTQYTQYQQQQPVQGYEQVYTPQGQGQGHPIAPPPAPVVMPELTFPQKQLQQIQSQQHQYDRYESDIPSRMRDLERRGGTGGLIGGGYQHKVSNIRSGSGGGGSGGGQNKNKKRSRRGATTTPASSTHEKHQHYHQHHRSSRSPAPTDSQIRLSPAEGLTTATATAAAATNSPEYAVHVPAYQLGATPSMDYLEISRRFERLVMPEDFIEVIRSGAADLKQTRHPPLPPLPLTVPAPTTTTTTTTTTIDAVNNDGLGLSTVFNLNGSLPVHHEICTEKVESMQKTRGHQQQEQQHLLALYDPDPLLTSPPPPLPLPRGAADRPVVYNAKVVLLSGLSEADKQSILSHKTTPSTNDNIKNTSNKKGSATASANPSVLQLPDHISCRLKFIVARAERAGVKSGIFPLGGRCDPGIDGDPEDPINGGDAALINAAKRHVLIQTGVDLSPCQRWLKILEIRYFRPGPAAALDALNTTGASDSNMNNTSGGITITRAESIEKGYFEVCTIFLIDDGHSALPCRDEWPAAWENRHTTAPHRMKTLVDKPTISVHNVVDNEEESIQNMDNPNKINNEDEDCEEGELPETASPLLRKSTPLSPNNNPSSIPKVEMPPDPRLLFIGLYNKKLRLKTMSISLDGLLDYNESDVEEATFEMSLFAETMHEMLSRDAGETIFKALKEKPWNFVENKKSNGDGKSGKNEKNEQPMKKWRRSGEKQQDKMEDTTGPPEFIAFNEEDNEDEEETDDTQQQDEEEDKNQAQEKNLELLLEQALYAFSYFDAGGLGYILTEDLHVIIESLGLHVHHGMVKQLCHAAAEASSKKSSNGGGDGKKKVEYRKLCCGAGRR